MPQKKESTAKDIRRDLFGGNSEAVFVGIKKFSAKYGTHSEKAHWNQSFMAFIEGASESIACSFYRTRIGMNCLPKQASIAEIRSEKKRFPCVQNCARMEKQNDKKIGEVHSYEGYDCVLRAGLRKM